MNIRRWALPLGVAAAVAVAAVAYWRQHNGDRALEHIASGNGRIEAVEIDIAPRQPGRIEAIEVREGETSRHVSLRKLLLRGTNFDQCSFDTDTVLNPA